jgi:hypothetical protein
MRISTAQMLLIDAVKSGRICQVRHFLRAGINVNLADENGQTALIHCSFLEEVKVRMNIFRLLLSHEIQVEKKDRYGRAALSWMCLLGRIGMFGVLLNDVNHKVDLNVFDNEGNSVIMLAVLSGDLAMVRLLIDTLKNFGMLEQVNRFNNKGMCSLIVAFNRQDHKCAKLLIKDGKASISSALQYIQQPWRNRYLQNVQPVPSRGQACHTFMRAAQLDPRRIPKLPTEKELLRFLYSDDDSQSGIDNKPRTRAVSAYAQTARYKSNCTSKLPMERRPSSSKHSTADLGTYSGSGTPGSLGTVSMVTDTNKSAVSKSAHAPVCIIYCLLNSAFQLL